MTAQEVAELMVQAARVVLAERDGHGLTSAQWMALRFLARANTFSRTLSGLASYQATTRGTASQTIKSLESSGFLDRGRSARDGRSSVLDVTSKGRKILTDDPVAGLVREIEALDEQQRHALRDALRQIVMHLANGEPRRAVGTCRDCIFCAVRRLRTADGGVRTSHVCKAIGLPIDERDLDLLCVSFQPLERR